MIRPIKWDIAVQLVEVNMVQNNTLTLSTEMNSCNVHLFYIFFKKMNHCLPFISAKLVRTSRLSHGKVTHTVSGSVKDLLNSPHGSQTVFIPTSVSLKKPHYNFTSPTCIDFLYYTHTLSSIPPPAGWNHILLPGHDMLLIWSVQYLKSWKNKNPLLHDWHLCKYPPLLRHGNKIRQQ